MSMPTKPQQRDNRDSLVAPLPWRIACTTPSALALLVILTCAAYLPALRGGFIWDDNAHVTKARLRSLQGLGQIWFDVHATQQYYPVLHSFFWVQCQLWGDHPLGYHLVNVFLHAMVVCLLYLVLRKLKIPGTLLAAAIFAVHPVMVESVAWISEQKNTLSAGFYLSAMLVYLRFDESRKRSLYAAALALFLLAVGSKTVTATLPAALLVIFWWQRGRLSWKRDVLPLVPFFVLGAAAGLFTAWVERSVGGAEGAAYELSIMQRGLLAGRAPWFYLGKLLWPANLIFIYPRWDLDASQWLQWLFPLLSVAMLIFLWTQRTRSRAPLAGWLLFVGTLFPALGFFNIYPFRYSFVADHFQYLASLGMIVLAAAALALAIAQLPHKQQWIGYFLCATLVGALGAITWQQAQMYSDAVTLYQTTIDKNPTCWMAHNNLGIEFTKAHKSQDAIGEFQKTLQIKPDFAEAEYNVANEFAKNGDAPAAIEHFQQALQIDPQLAAAHGNLGRVLMETGHPQEAIQHFEQAFKIEPRFAMAHYDLGNLRLNSGEVDQAIDQYRETIQISPDFAEGHNNLGIALARAGRAEEAIEQFNEVLRLKPDFAGAHNNLGNLLRDAGRPEEALAHYRRSIELQPDDLLPYANLAHLLAALGRPTEAIATAQQALEMANSQGQTALAQQIETWLTKYRGEQTQTPEAAPSSQSLPAAPKR